MFAWLQIVNYAFPDTGADEGPVLSEGMYTHQKKYPDQHTYDLVVAVLVAE